MFGGSMHVKLALITIILLLAGFHEAGAGGGFGGRRPRGSSRDPLNPVSLVYQYQATYPSFNQTGWSRPGWNGTVKSYEYTTGYIGNFPRSWFGSIPNGSTYGTSEWGVYTRYGWVQGFAWRTAPMAAVMWVLPDLNIRDSEAHIVITYTDDQLTQEACRLVNAGPIQPPPPPPPLPPFPPPTPGGLVVPSTNSSASVQVQVTADRPPPPPAVATNRSGFLASMIFPAANSTPPPPPLRDGYWLETARQFLLSMPTSAAADFDTFNATLLNSTRTYVGDCMLVAQPPAPPPPAPPAGGTAAAAAAAASHLEAYPAVVSFLIAGLISLVVMTGI